MNVFSTIASFLLLFSLLTYGSISQAARGQLEINSDPGDAEIYINGKRKGNTPDKSGMIFLIKLKEGEHTIRLYKKNGNYEYVGDKNIFLAEDTLQGVNITLNKKPTKTYALEINKKKKLREEWRKTHWEIVYGASRDWDRGSKISILNNGDIVAAGGVIYYGTDPLKFGVNILKISAKGKVRWSKQINRSADNVLGIFPNSSMGIKLVTYGDGLISLIHIASDGKVISRKNIKTTLLNPYLAIELANGNIIIPGRTTHKSQVLALNKNGKEIWRKTLSSGKVQSVVESINSSILVVGEDNSGVPGIEIDANGSIIRQHHYGIKGDYATEIIKLSDGGFLIAGYVKDYNGSRDMLAIKLNTDAKEVWRNRFGEGKSDDEAYTAAELRNGNIVLAGYSNDGSQTYLQKISQDGSAISKLVNRKGSIRSAIAMNDGGILMVGDRKYSPRRNYQMTIMRTDNNGNFKLRK